MKSRSVSKTALYVSIITLAFCVGLHLGRQHPRTIVKEKTVIIDRAVFQKLPRGQSIEKNRYALAAAIPATALRAEK